MGWRNKNAQEALTLISREQTGRATDDPKSCRYFRLHGVEPQEPSSSVLEAQPGRWEGEDAPQFLQNNMF